MILTGKKLLVYRFNKIKNFVFMTASVLVTASFLMFMLIVL